MGVNYLRYGAKVASASQVSADSLGEEKRDPRSQKGAVLSGQAVRFYCLGCSIFLNYTRKKKKKTPTF